MSEHEKIEGAEDQPRLSLEKARDEIRTVVEWLLTCSDREKLVVFAVENLLRHGPGLNRTGRYDGDVGQDVWRDWRDRLRAMLGDESQVLDPRDRTMLAFVMELDDEEV